VNATRASKINNRWLNILIGYDAMVECGLEPEQSRAEQQPEVLSELKKAKTGHGRNHAIDTY